MEKLSDDEVSSSSGVATVEEIQKRLLRPSSSSFASHWRDDIISQVPSQFDQNSYEQLTKKKKSEGAKIQRLEDYLDPVLLSIVGAKINGKRKNRRGEIKKTRKSDVYEFDRFEWLGDPHRELKASCRRARSRGEVEDTNDVADLNAD